MKSKNIFAVLLVVSALCALPTLASAHERQVINIGGTDYLFVVGSLGEPVVVDDKTGVDFRIKVADPKDPTNASGAGAKPVTGLEQTLKVELIAGDKKKTQDLTPAYNDAGAYKTTFFPTVQTTLTYRFFGTINNTPVDLSFVCNPAGSPKVADDKTSVSLGTGVTRTFKAGGFGCPLAKEDLGFPEDAMTVLGLHEDLHGDMDGMMKTMATDQANNQSGAAITFGLLGMVFGIIAFIKARRSKE